MENIYLKNIQTRFRHTVDFCTAVYHGVVLNSYVYTGVLLYFSYKKSRKHCQARETRLIREVRAPV